MKIVLPKTAPLLRESHQYAYQPDPDLPKVVIQRRIDGLKQQLGLVEKQLKASKWYQRINKNLHSRKAWLIAQIGDAELELQKVIANRSPIGV